MDPSTDGGHLLTCDGISERVADVSPTFNATLLCSDVANEGLNLHYFCHRLGHFDMPRSLMVFQQRNGRVDRYGQKHQPHFVYLFTEPGALFKGDYHFAHTALKQQINQPEMLCQWTAHDAEQIIAITAPADLQDRLPHRGTTDALTEVSQALQAAWPDAVASGCATPSPPSPSPGFRCWQHCATRLQPRPLMQILVTSQ